MKSIILIAALLASPAYADDDTDYPHRDWGKSVKLDMTLGEATACVAREMDRKGSVLIVPVDGGNDIDFSAQSMFSTVGEPWERFKIRSKDGETTLRIFYRHPVNRRWIENRDMKRLKKSCLKVLSITPS